MIGSGRTKLETDEQFELARKHCEVLGITALVIIGGDDSNTNACMLAEYFKSHNVGIQVVGCPKTIDGDLKNEWIEASFGFDTACRVYSELIGNIGRDANSAKKYWHFIKLMGRSASHIALECALQTQPNIAIISEEVAAKKMTLAQIVEEMAVVVAARAKAGMNFGVALIPEGLIEFVPEIKVLIAELNDLLAANAAKVDAMEKADKVAFANANLSAESAKVFGSLPTGIQMQLCNDRDPHGNVQVSLIETEKMLAEMVGTRLKQMKSEGAYDGKFSTQVHFFGYEGRCAAPSNYDADYCYSLGYNAAALIGAGKTGYMSSVRNTMLPASKWIAGGIPITMMMNIERRHGHDKPVIKKALVELDGAPFKFFAAHRAEWAKETVEIDRTCDTFGIGVKSGKFDIERAGSVRGGFDVFQRCKAGDQLRIVVDPYHAVAAYSVAEEFPAVAFLMRTPEVEAEFFDIDIAFVAELLHEVNPFGFDHETSSVHVSVGKPGSAAFDAEIERVGSPCGAAHENRQRCTFAAPVSARGRWSVAGVFVHEEHGKLDEFGGDKPPVFRFLAAVPFQSGTGFRAEEGAARILVIQIEVRESRHALVHAVGIVVGVARRSQAVGEKDAGS